MAGICGIVIKVLDKIQSLDYALPLKHMLDGLSGANPAKVYNEIDRFYVGCVTTRLGQENGNLDCENALGVTCIVEGIVFINEEVKQDLIKEYGLSNGLPSNQYLPYLYSRLGDEFPDAITGSYNIFIYYRTKQEAILLNDRLGFLPLYIYESESILLFSSRVESLIASGLMSSVEIDLVSVSEALFFNYILSDNTYIKHVRMLGPGQVVKITSNGAIHIRQYWQLSDIFPEKPLSKKESLEAVDSALQQSILKAISSTPGTINFSLTGGWDSRLVLSYLMPIKDRLHLYSFGSPDSPDISIPRLIAQKEDMFFTSYLLDGDYLANEFKSHAADTIMNSGGARTYKRAHYLYAVKKNAIISDFAISGIYGDEVLKIGNVKPCDVISQNAINLITSDFDIGAIVEKYRTDKMWRVLTFDKKYPEEFAVRMQEIKGSAASYRSIAEKYYYFRFKINLRKYFGAEVNSYNDFTNSFSPFTDTDFLSAYFKSGFSGIHYPFNKSSISRKLQSVFLYHELIKRNYSALLDYPTDRGYSIADITSLLGIIRIGMARLGRRHGMLDAYATKPTNDLFIEMCREYSDNIENHSIPFNWDRDIDSRDSKILSLQYWFLSIQNKYRTSK